MAVVKKGKLDNWLVTATLLISFCFLAFPSAGLCENKLIGQVTNEITGEPIVHARIGVFLVPEDEGGDMKRIATTVTDEKGGYEMRSIPPGTYTLKVEAPDYRMKISSIIISSHDYVTFTENVQLLKKDAEELTAKQRKARDKLAEALAAVESGDQENAIKLMNKAVDLDPNYAAAYNCLGIEYQKVQDAENSLKNFKKAVDLDGEDPAHLMNLGGFYVATAKFAEAVPLLQKAISLDTLSSHGHALLGEAFYRENKMQEAEAEMVKALNLDPEANSNLLLFLGNMKMKAKAYIEAREYFQKYLAANPDAPNKDKIQKNIDVINQGLSGQK